MCRYMSCGWTLHDRVCKGGVEGHKVSFQGAGIIALDGNDVVSQGAGKGSVDRHYVILKDVAIRAVD